MKTVWTLLRWELRLAWCRQADLARAPVFLVIGATLFPLALGPDRDILGQAAGAIIWALALLAPLLTLDGILREDFEDGTLDQTLSAGVPLGAVLFAKTASHWVGTGVPILVISPLLGLVLGLPAQGQVPLLAGLLLGGPALSLMGLLGASLILGARGESRLVALFLTVPLCLPILVFGAGAVNLALGGMEYTQPLLLLAGLLLLALALIPWVAMIALRAALAG